MRRRLVRRMNETVYCRFCKYGKMELEQDAIEDEIKDVIKMYWYECPLCGSRSPISNTPEGAKKYAIFGYK